MTPMPFNLVPKVKGAFSPREDPGERRYGLNVIHSPKNNDHVVE
jgi:hypothetical protein